LEDEVLYGAREKTDRWRDVTKNKNKKRDRQKKSRTETCTSWQDFQWGRSTPMGSATKDHGDAVPSDGERETSQKTIVPSDERVAWQDFRWGRSTPMGSATKDHTEAVPDLVNSRSSKKRASQKRKL
jgi:hypothetical protein